jgi:hypothetical protein
MPKYIVTFTESIVYESIEVTAKDDELAYQKALKIFEKEKPDICDTDIEYDVEEN